MKLDFTKPNVLKKELLALEPYDIAEEFINLSDEEQLKVFYLLGAHKSAKVFSRLSSYLQQEVFGLLNGHEQKQLLDYLETDELKAFINYFSDHHETQEEIIKLLSKEKANLIKDLLIYSQDSAPSIMSNEFITITHTMSVKEATSYIFNNVKDDDFIDHIYVSDEDDKLIGLLTLKDLIIARGSDELSSLLNKDYIFVYNDHSIIETIEIVRNYDIPAVPVIDHSGFLLGIITADDVLKQLINNYDKAYQKLANIQNHDEAYSGFKRSLTRLPWLVIAIVLNLIIASILASVTAFQLTVSSIITLVLFQPMILDMAGNIGTQNLAVTILEVHRDGLDDKKEKKTFIRREVFVALLNSLFVAISGFAITFVITLISRHVSLEGVLISPLKMGIVVSGALFVSMALSGLLGTFIPLILTKINADTDNAAGPILTTLNDIIALFTYYGIAYLLFML